MRAVGWMCSRIRDIACSNSSRASRELRPIQGWAAAWAVLPKNSTSVAVSASRVPTVISFLSLGCQESTTSLFLKAPPMIMNVLPIRISSAGEPKTWIVPGSFCSTRARLAATAAAIAAVPRRLCPQPCPGASATRGSFFASPACCESPGRASYSARTPTTGEPDPAVATHAVLIPPTLRVTLNPSFSRSSAVRFADLVSCRAGSENSQICVATFSQRERVWSRYASVAGAAAARSRAAMVGVMGV